MAEEQVANGAQDGAPKTGGKEKKGFFYGWWIVIGGFMIMATCYTAFVNCMSLFQAQIVGDLGMTIGEYNTGTSLASLISIVGTLIIGFLLDKINARAIAVGITALAVPRSAAQFSRRSSATSSPPLVGALLSWYLRLSAWSAHFPSP